MRRGIGKGFDFRPMPLVNWHLHQDHGKIHCWVGIKICTKAHLVIRGWFLGSMTLQFSKNQIGNWILYITTILKNLDKLNNYSQIFGFLGENHHFS